MNRLLLKIFFRSVTFTCVAALVLFNTSRCLAQKYSFSHYDIEDGLIQSQINKLCQDNAHRLWIATLGGACRFDGREYYAVSKANGLINNFVYTVFVDKSGLVWFGTHKGLAYIKGQKVINFPVPKTAKNTWVDNIVQDAGGRIFVTMSNHVYQVTGNTLQLNSNPIDTVSGLATDRNGRLYATIYKKGLYRFNKNKWQSYIQLPPKLQEAFIKKIEFDRTDDHKIYLLSYKGLLIADGANVYADERFGKINEAFMSFAQDADNNLWIGTTNGAYRASKQNIIHFTAKNGFTDNAISDIYADAAGNLWFATEGNGLFKYEGDSYVVFDQSQGMSSNQIVMGIGRDKHDNIILGTDGNGLVKYKDGIFSNLIPLSDHSERRIQSLYTDNNKNLWIGTGGSGAWKYDGKDFEPVKGIQERTVGPIISDARGTIWLGTYLGCYYYENKILKRVSDATTFVTALLPISRDSMLIGTQTGVRLAVNKKMATAFKLNALNTSAIFCMIKAGDNVLFGTDDKGLFTWNIKTGAIKNYSVKDGFKSNSIYSLVADKKGIIWAGTGRGVNRVLLDNAKNTATILPNNSSKDLIVETNQNASFRDGDKILIGTTKGLAVYNTNTGSQAELPPYIVLQSIKILPQGNVQKQSFINPDMPGMVKLSSNQNHLAISFLGVYLKNPRGVSYQYKLNGLDDKFSPPVKNNEVEYPSLPPGNYTFEVKAISPDGLVSTNTAKFSFEIVPPFYKTLLFQAGVIICFILLGILMQAIWQWRKLQRQQAIEVMKREEKMKIRQQTAEDFHDDLGNKLTRITILSEILNAKIDKDKTEQIGLVDQIKQNAAALYNGTKDILWALDPKSDNLYETLSHINEIGVELFHDTPVDFKFDGITDSLKDIKLPMEYSRNITMIFKELLNNILKHAAAKHVTITALTDEKDRLCLYVTDDGKGFEYNNATRGHGLNNIQARTLRIDAELLVYSEIGKGTKAELKFKKNHKI